MATFVIIATYNGEKFIRKCLSSVTDYETIVVDNNSSDETLNIIEEEFPNTHILTQNKNIGFGAANNLGISYALKKGADGVFLINQDAYMIGDSIANLVSLQKKHPNYGILSPIHLESNLERLEYRFGHYVSHQFNLSFSSDHIIQNKISNIYDFDFINAAGWLITRQCLEVVGGFDPIFFHYGEDDNYCQRVLYHGFKIGVATKNYMVHDRPIKKRPVYEYGTKGYLNKIELKLKIYGADVNKADTGILEHRIQQEYKVLMKRIILGKFQKAKISRIILKRLKLIKPMILKSKSINKTRGAHYLELE